MDSTTENRSLARVAGVFGVLGHIAAAILYIVLPGLEVPYPALYAFQAAWLIVLGVTVWWLRSHPWRSLLVPAVGAVVVSIARILGEHYLGWRG